MNFYKNDLGLEFIGELMKRDSAHIILPYVTHIAGH